MGRGRRHRRQRRRGPGRRGRFVAEDGDALGRGAPGAHRARGRARTTPWRRRSQRGPRQARPEATPRRPDGHVPDRRPPRSTYRLQITADFDLLRGRAAAAVPARPRRRLGVPLPDPGRATRQHPRVRRRGARPGRRVARRRRGAGRAVRRGTPAGHGRARRHRAQPHRRRRAGAEPVVAVAARRGAGLAVRRLLRRRLGVRRRSARGALGGEPGRPELPALLHHQHARRRPCRGPRGLRRDPRRDPPLVRRGARRRTADRPPRRPPRPGGLPARPVGADRWRLLPRREDPRAGRAARGRVVVRGDHRVRRPGLDRPRARRPRRGEPPSPPCGRLPRARPRPQARRRPGDAAPGDATDRA